MCVWVLLSEPSDSDDDERSTTSRVVGFGVGWDGDAEEG